MLPFDHNCFQIRIEIIRIYFFCSEESKKRRPMEQQLSLAADSANCTSSRLRARADKLRELSSNAKSWGSDIREAQDKLIRSVNKPLSVTPPVIQITPPNGKC